MTRKSKARYNLNRTYKVSQTVKALRRALALGLATAAVAPSAQAGTCLSIVNDLQCFGDFGDVTLDSWNELAVSDVYDPATVDMNGTLYTNNSDGIIAWNFDDIAFTNDGTVLVNDSWYSEWSYNRVGVYAESFQGDVAFDNTGVIGAIENSGNSGTSFTVGARIEAAQDITATNSGFIGSENDGGFAAGMQAVSYGGGTINITNTATGDIGAEANNFGSAVALGVYGGGGVVNITNNGDIAAASEDDTGFGIRVFNGDISITTGSTSEINIQGGEDALGIAIETGGANAVDITNAGLIETDAGDDAYGIRVFHYGYGDVTVSNSGTIDSYAANDWAAGIAVYANDGDVTVTNSQYGTILADGDDDSAGIIVRTDTGDITISNAGDIYSVSEDAAGVVALGKYRTTIDISNSGTIGVVADYSNTGTSAVGVYSAGYSNDTTVTNSGLIYAVNGTDVNAGVVIVGPGTGSYGTATVTNTGVISAGKYSEGGGTNSFGDAFGVFADVNGDVSVTNTGTYSEYGNGAAGILAYNEEGGWTVGVQASSNNGDVSVTNSNKYSVISAVSSNNSYGPGFSTTIGIYAEAFDGSVSVNNGGIVFSVNDNFGDAIGIRAEAFENDMMAPLVAYAADGDITVSNTGFVAAVSKYDNAAGVQAFSNNGDITISNTGTAAALKYAPEGVIYAIAEDGYATGIQAQTGGDGNITISNTGGYVIAEGLYGATGISADTYSGNITVTNAASANGYGGVVLASGYYYSGDAVGINAFSDYGNIAVTNSGYVVAESAYGSAFGINASTGDYSSGTITVTNTGYVIADGYDSSFGINANTDTGAITISNNTDANGNGGVVVAMTDGEYYAYGINASINDYNSTANISITNGYGALIYAQASTASEYADTYGIRAYNAGSGDILITNAGTISAYSYDDAYAISAYAYGDGDISITNTATGSLVAVSEEDEAFGIYAWAEGDGNITVTNAGDINAYTYGGSGDAYGIYAYANGDGNITVTNSGTITASTEGVNSDAYGIYAYADGNGDIAVTSSGTIIASATANGGDAYGIYAYANGDGDITVTSSGTITATTTGDNAEAYGVSAYADGDGNVTVTNSGTLTVSTSGNSSEAYGVYAEAVGDGNVTVTNSGTLTVSTSGNSSEAFGVYAYAQGDGDVLLTNTATGIISVTTSGDDSDAYAASVQADSGNFGDATLINAGSMTATTTGYDSDAYGVYIESDGDGNITVTNSGSITATTSGDDSDAYGVYAQHEDYGDVVITNTATGSITATTSGYNSDSFGISVFTYGYEPNGNISINNSGDITVSAGGEAGDAFGIDVDANNSVASNISITNTATGTIDVSSDYGTATGVGVYAEMVGDLNDGGSISITNAGDILVEAAYTANGIAVNVDEGSNYFPRQYSFCAPYSTCTNVYGGNYYTGYYGTYFISEASFSTPGQGGMPVTISNSGLIDVASDYSNAEGITVNMGNGSYGELASITNSGTINVVTEDGFLAWGIHVDNQFGDISVSNTATGTIDVANESAFNYGGYYYFTGSGYAVGIRTFAEYGDTTISNAGDIIVGNSPWRSNGIRAENKYGDVTVSNLAGGSISVNTGGLDAYGIEVDNKYGDVNVSNAGSITVETGYWNSKGIEVENEFGDTVITTAAGSSITVTGEGSRVTGGILGYSETGDITVTNAGIMTVTADNFAVGIRANTEDYGDITITNAVSGRINVTSSYSRAVGIDAYADGAGDIVISNAGIITATGLDGDAFGINAETDNDQNYASGGAITITTVAGSSITATANGDFGDAYGMYVRIEEDANMAITNGGSITATANGYQGDAYGIYAEVQGSGNLTLTNTAAITASASGDYGDAYGIYAYAHDGSTTVSNSAAITATANGYQGDAYGIYAYASGGNASVTNAAAGHVRATGDSATGISVQSDSYGYDVTLNNAGKITVVSRDGDAYGAYVETDGDGTLSITSSGDITVSASGSNDYAVGLYAQHEGYGDITIASSSTITVNSTGSGGDAVGIKATSYDGSDMSVSNSGTILANATNGGFSVGIYTENFGGSETTITNSGSVKATGVDAYAIYHYGTDVDIVNTSTGKIFGVVYTDYGNDTFTNNGKWYATEGVNYVSEFQEGDDNIVNSATGRIYMEDSYIDLGYAEGSVNSFLNNGKLYANGDANYIDMGGNGSVFTNNGSSIHMEDGAANDALTIFGDFAGTGKIVVDANGTSMLADRLYIEGDVISNTANVIDVYLNENPSLQDMVDGELIDIVFVSGTSAAANFNLGIVDVEDDLLYTVDYELIKQINYSGTNDLFSLGFEITGLTPTGVAMSSIAPAVQNLWHLGVGTVFQREGTMRDGQGGSGNSLMNAGFKNATGGGTQVADYQGAAGLWLRTFTEDGGLNPVGGRGNFGLGGEQSFDMKNSGIEFGAGYAFNGEWAVGLLGGVSDGSVKPTVGGRTSIDAKTIGGYLTYTPGNGLYADLSYRSMDFDGDGNGGGEDFSFEGRAKGFSLEVGYGIKTASDLVIEPQFQYSSMDVDLDSVDYNQDDFSLDDGKSSQVRLGVSLRKTMDTGNGNSWTPYASLSYLNESNASNDYTIGGVLTGNVDTSGNSTLFEGGATVKYGNMLFSGGLNWKDGGAYESMFGGQVSVRFTW